MNSIVSVQKEIYKPVFNENNDKYIDVCPYKPRERNRIHYQCRCKAGTVFTNRQDFTQHIKSKTHKTFIKNYSEYYKEVDEAEEKNRKLIADNEILKRKVDLREEEIKMRGIEIETLMKKIESIEKDNKKTKDQLHIVINGIDGLCDNINDFHIYR